MPALGVLLEVRGGGKGVSSTGDAEGRRMSLAAVLEEDEEGGEAVLNLTVSG